MSVNVSSHPARNAFVALALCLGWILVCYRETAQAMVEIWYRSETFNHGFIVLPITLWLIWQRRDELARLPIRPAPGAIPLVALTAAGWLLGDLAGVNSVTHLAFVALLVLAVPAVLGMAITRAIAFPLGFLFFMVPIGEFAMPTLMDWTAEFTVFALRLTGIPVYQEGLQFVIPSGRWSVVEACSGVRYLIASACVGMLFAYLNYKSTKRRLIFVGVSLLVPIVANWLRAYLIVIIGHLSDGKLAAGVDHLIYGWLFFGVVILLMFVIGGRWSDRVTPGALPNQAPLPASAASFSASPALPLIFAALVAAPHLGVLAIERSERSAAVQLASIGEIQGWQRNGLPAEWQPAFSNPSAALTEQFERGNDRVGVHIAYYRNQDYVRKLVSSNNQLVASKDPVWAKVAGNARQTILGSDIVAIRMAELRGGAEQRLVVWHWYWINGRLTSSDHLAKLYTALDRLTGRGDDSAAIFVFSPKNAGAESDAIENFLRDGIGPVTDALQRTRAQR